MNHHHSINYIEFPARDLPAVKSFFEEVFDWKFVDYGEEYTSFKSPGMEGGFYRSDLQSTVDKGAALIVFYSKNLEVTRHNIHQAGGAIVKPVFSFPGGKRFHFSDPSGNEFAVWSEK